MSVTLQDMQNALSTLGMTLESSPEIRQLAEKVRAEGGTAVPVRARASGNFFPDWGWIPCCRNCPPRPQAFPPEEG